MSDFRKAFMWTTIPIVALSLISTAGLAVMAGQVAGTGWGGSTTLGFWIFASAWAGAVACAIAAIVVLIIFGVKGERQIAAGILAGIGIGVVSLGATCFANVAMLLGR